MSLSLKLRKHGLTEHGSTEALHEMVQKIRLLLLILRHRQQVTVQQRLITRRRYLRDENLVSRVHIGAAPDRKTRSAGSVPSHGQGEDAVQCTAEIEQHIRMRPVDTPGVRAASLAFIFIDIDPAVIEAFLQKSQILYPSGPGPLFTVSFASS